MDAIILARVSTEDQEDNFSIGAQTDRTQKYAEQKGLKVVKVFELVESASKDNRKKFEEMLKFAVKYKRPLAIVADTVDRITRNFKDAVVLDDLRKNGNVELHFYRENLVITKDSNSSEIMRWDTAVLFAKQFALQIGDNVKRSIDRKRAAGEIPGPAPFGYKNIDRENGTKWVEPDPVTSLIVQDLFAKYSTKNFSLEQLTHYVAEEYSLRMHKSKIHRILTSPIYAGYLLYKGELIKHQYTPLVNGDVYDFVQELISGRATNRVMRFKGKEYAFRGLIRCTKCKRVLTPENHRGKVYYRCAKGKSHGMPYVNEGVLEAQLDDLLGRMKIPSHNL